MATRISDLVKFVAPLFPDDDGTEACRRFRADAALTAVPVVRDDIPLGLVLREDLAGHLLSADGKARMLAQSVTDLMRHDISLCELQASVAFAAANGGEAVRHGLIAVDSGQYAGLVDAGSVLTCLAGETAARAQAMKSMRARLDMQREQAKRHSDEQARFLAMLSHEIRTPLTGVLGLADLLCHAGLEAAPRDYARAISDSGRMLERLLSDLLDMSRLDAGKMPIQPEAFSLADFARETRALWSAQAGSRNVALTVACDDREATRLEADADRLRQILFNLVSNALKFTDAGKVDVMLRVEAEEDGDLVLRMSVRDTGPGITPELRARLFRAFEQASPETVRRHGGSGLGLAIAKGLAERMGGTIVLSDNPGGGAVFSVTCPVRRAGPRLAVENPRKRVGQCRLGRILVVDDHDVSRYVIEEALAGAGWKVDSVATVAQAMRRAGETGYQAMLIDLRLGEESGLALARRIRTGGGPNMSVPLLAATADVSDEARAACTGAGFQGFVAKPIRPRDMVATLVDAILDGEQALPVAVRRLAAS